MRRIILLPLLIVLILPISGCIDEEEGDFYCGCCPDYEVNYTYSGLNVSCDYESVFIEEPLLIESLKENFTLNETRADHSNPGGRWSKIQERSGYYKFDLFNHYEKRYDKNTSLFLVINEYDMSPGYSDGDNTYGSWNIFPTNISLVFCFNTKFNTTGLNSTDKDTAVNLSNDLYEKDLEFYEDWIEDIQGKLILIFGVEPDHFSIDRQFHYEYLY